jgi:membrane dipeptidase
MEDCSKLPNLTAQLMRRGYSEADLTNVLGENALRVMEACRKRAGELEGTAASA